MKSNLLDACGLRPCFGFDPLSSYDPIAAPLDAHFCFYYLVPFASRSSIASEASIRNLLGNESENHISEGRIRIAMDRMCPWGICLLCKQQKQD